MTNRNACKLFQRHQPREVAVNDQDTGKTDEANFQLISTASQAGKERKTIPPINPKHIIVSSIQTDSTVLKQT